MSTNQNLRRYQQKRDFELVTTMSPKGDQPKAIDDIKKSFKNNQKEQVLLGVTGSGKTFTMAHVLASLNQPTLILAHNKTLAGQLYGEFKELFPNNSVEYFVSYYDYYQPEAYVPSSDTYIDKDATINDAIDRMRHSATRSLFERNDVIIVSSVSCIYGLGSAEAYMDMLVFLKQGMEISRDAVLKKLVEIQYERNDIDFHRGTFRVRGDVLEVFPAHEDEIAIRVEWFGDEIESIQTVDPLRGKKIGTLDKAAIYPATHYAVTPDSRERAMASIKSELTSRLEHLRRNEQLLEAQRLEQRTEYDLEMMAQMGYCNGIENYSRHLTGRPDGAPPPTLVDYFPDNYLLIIDESHQTVPQLGAMYKGDRARKSNLVEFGFRLPSALDNRPLRFDEFQGLTDKIVYVSATPGDYELERTQGVVVEQVIRPTGLVDPQIEVRPAQSQVDDVLGEIPKEVARGFRILVTTLTKRMAEDLSEFMADVGIRVRYLHSEVDTLERSVLINELRAGTYDVLVGINLLREGLDIPEVSLVAILDADKEGFLRSERSLVQTIGRAARNVEGRVIMYADSVTKSMKLALDETDRRRGIQEAHNQKHGITPQTIQKSIRSLHPSISDDELKEHIEIRPEDAPRKVEILRREMLVAADALDFEKAADLRDQIRQLEDRHLRLG